MDADAYARAREIFAGALARTGEARSQYVAEACQDAPEMQTLVAGLLVAHEEAGGFLGDASDDAASALTIPVGGHLDTEPGSAQMRAIQGDLGGTQIGPYRVLRQIGRGGMGAVYLGMRDDEVFRKRVAIKVLAPARESSEMVRRFQAERRILAALNHPNIAQVLDGGTTDDGRPFLVMEYVEGKAIDAYCRDAELDVDRRLRLFLTVCDAVETAHRNMVVHRDLKPSNILVTADGIVKLLDFGIAKLLKPELAGVVEATVSSLRMLTPRYASPEQVAGRPITAASDVYALGVLLYELLTGCQPYEPTSRSAAALLDAIVTQEPLPPSEAARKDSEAVAPTARRLAKRLEGDLDAITLMALNKVSERRYVSVTALAEDVRRHLANEPVSARPHSMIYRLRTFARRHRIGTIACASMALALVTFSVATVRQTRRSELAYQQADRERIRAERVTAMLTQLFQPADPEAAAAAPSPTARELLDRAAERVPIELVEEPTVQVSLNRTLGVIYRNLGLLEPAVDLLRRALDGAIEHYGDDHAETLAVQHELAIAYFERGDMARAESLYVRLREAYQEQDAGDEQRLGRVLNDLGVLRFVQEEHEEAAALLEEALDTRRGLGISAEQAESLHNLGLVENRRGRLERGESLLREGLRMRRRVFGDEHTLVANSLVGIARLRLVRDDPADAERLASEALRVMEAVLAPRDWRIAVVETLQGRCLVALDRFEEAESVLLEAYGKLLNHAGRGSRPVTQARDALISLYEARGDDERAEAFRSVD